MQGWQKCFFQVIKTLSSNDLRHDKKKKEFQKIITALIVIGTTESEHLPHINGIHG